MKEIIKHLGQTYGIKNINWSAQMMITKSLLKTYTKEQLLYAIDYYKKRGVEIYSMGYFKNSMDKPCRELEAQRFIANQDTGDSSERNQRKFREADATFGREKCYFDLFEEPNENH